jgi:hypothetical protein
MLLIVCPDAEDDGTCSWLAEELTMINGVHTLLYSTDPDATREFFPRRDAAVSRSTRDAAG